MFFLITITLIASNKNGLSNAEGTCSQASIFTPGPNDIRKCPKEIFTAFRNPGKGWLVYNFKPTITPANAQDTPLASAIYTNDFLWSDLEPTEGDYRWDLIDILINNWKDKKKIKIGIMLEAPFARHSKEPIPDWVRSQIQGGFYTGSDIWEPKYTDPIFIQKYNNFINAFAQRYYNKPNNPESEDWQKYLKSIDINTFGPWGEWYSKFPFRVEQISVGTFLNNASSSSVLFSFDDLNISNDTQTVLSDSFSRTESGKWGSATLGAAYSTATDATLIDYNVNGFEGTLNTPVGSNRKAYVASISEHNVDIKLKVKTDKVMQGGSGLVDISTRRRSPANTEYKSRLIFNTNGSLSVNAIKRINNVDSNIGSYTTIPGINHNPNTYYWFRTKISGSNPSVINIKIWPDGSSEPSSWNFTASDSDPSLQENYGHEKYDTLKGFIDTFANAFSGSVKPDFKMNIMGSSSNGPSTLQDTDEAGVNYAVKEIGASMIRRMIGYGEKNLKPDEEQFIAENLSIRQFDGEWGSADGKVSWIDNPNDNSPLKQTYEAIDQALSLGATHLGWYKNTEQITCSTIPAEVTTEYLPEKSQCTSPTDVITVMPFDKLYPGTNETLRDYFQRRSGYRFYISESIYPASVSIGQGFDLKQAWYQRGVAKLYNSYNIKAYLVSGSTRIPLNNSMAFDAHAWEAGPSGPHSVISHFNVPTSVNPGTYVLQFAVVDETAKPAMNLAIDTKDTIGLSDPINDYSYYTIGEINILPETDTTSPIVSISSPNTNTNVSGIITIAASADDNIGVTKVNFYKDGTLLSTDFASPYEASWDTNIYAHNSPHTLYAKAYDNSGNIGTSSAVNVTIKDITLPQVSITNPANGSFVSRNTNVTITANASDISGITKTEFLINGTLKCTDLAAPYSCVWKVPSAKGVNYSITVKAYDANNNSASSSIQVTSR